MLPATTRGIPEIKSYYFWIVPIHPRLQGGAFSAPAGKVKAPPEAGVSHWVCLACGHVHEGNDPPDKCPVCTAPKSAFMPRQYYEKE